MNDGHVIDYAHARHGVLYHGTFSDLSGQPRATWTYEALDGHRQTDVAIDRDTFEFLWNGFSSCKVFSRHMVAAPNGPLDPAASHIIGLRFRDEQGDGHCTFTIPADEADVEFMAWLFALDPPYLNAPASTWRGRSG